MKPSVEKIEKFLIEVNRIFPVPISEKVDLHVFAVKLFKKATLCCIYDGEEIYSMVAGYTKNVINDIAYISLVATKAKVYGKGYATRLLKEFIGICRSERLKGVHLYTDTRNFEAIGLYQKLGFKIWNIEDEPRKKDLHYVYWICKNEVKI